MVLGDILHAVRCRHDIGPELLQVTRAGEQPRQSDDGNGVACQSPVETGVASFVVHESLPCPAAIRESWPAVVMAARRRAPVRPSHWLKTGTPWPGGPAPRERGAANNDLLGRGRPGAQGPRATASRGPNHPGTGRPPASPRMAAAACPAAG